MPRHAAVIVLLAAALAGVVALRLAIGPGGLHWPTGLEFELRRTRALSGLIVGASLGAAGVMLQSLLRNPLASPDLIGPSAGAALAVAIATYVRGRLALGPGTLPELAPLATAPAALVGA